MDRWVSGRVTRMVGGWRGEWVDGRWVSGWIMDGQVSGWVDGWMDE